MAGEVKTLVFASGVSVAGGAVPISYYLSDTTGWTGSVSEVAYDVSDQSISESYKMIWELRDPNASYVNMGGVVTHTSGTNVTITFMENLAVGTYILIGR